MIKIGVRKGDQRKVNDLLTRAHTLRVSVSLMDLDHRHLKNLSDRFIDGQVSVDADAAITRALDLTLFDPQGRIDIDPNSPGRASVFIADMIRTTIIIGEPDGSAYYSIPVFTGPIESVDRDDVFLKVKCLGKESLSLTNLWRGKVFKKGQRKMYVIEVIARTLMGETKMTLGNNKSKLPNNQKLSRSSAPFTVIRALAKTMDLRVFYDGRGIMQVRRRQKHPVITFNEKWLTDEPVASYDLKNTINAVDVIGRKPKKAKKPLRFRAIAKRTHPLSPWRLGRGNVPRYLWTEIRDDSFSSKAECKSVAKRNLKLGLMASTTIKFSGIPFPQMEEGDPIRVDSEKVHNKAVMRQFTIPLTAGDDASYGYLRRSRPRGGARMIKVKKKKGKRND